jgi:hypothetical protein
MATRTQTQRKAAAQKGAATRQRNAARRSASSTKSSARRTTRSAAATARSSRSTASQAARTGGRRVEAAAARLGAFGRQAQRVVLVHVGAAATARDALAKTAQKYSSVDRARRELTRLERRGERTLRRSRQAVGRRRRDFEHDLKQQLP